MENPESEFLDTVAFGVLLKKRIIQQIKKSFLIQKMRKPKQRRRRHLKHNRPTHHHAISMFARYRKFTVVCRKSQMEQKEEYLGSMDPFVETLLHESFGLEV